MATRTDSPGGGPAAKVLVLGEPEAAGEALVRRLTAGGAHAERLHPANDSEAKRALESDVWTAVAVVTRDDALALRLTLLCAHVRPELPLWATLFDRTIVHQLRAAVPHAHILSPAEIAAGVLADACLAAGARRRRRWTAGVRLVDDALRLLVAAGAGLVVVLVVQIVISITGLHEGGLDAVFFSARALATIADSPRANGAAWWFEVIATIDSLVAIGLLAVFTAALVRVVNRPRLTTAIGKRSAPARDHVLVVGFGQVGYRLAERLRARGVPVSSIERDPAAPCVRLAPGARLPVAIGRGDDRVTLERLGVRSCAAVAAVTSDDLTNVAVGMAVNDIAPGTALVLRLGDGDVAAETDSLLHLGAIRDIHDVAAGEMASEILAGPRLTPR